MKVIETIKNLRTGETTEVSWGNAITSDLSVLDSVVGILQHQRDRENGDIHEALLGRFQTIAIHIEL